MSLVLPPSLLLLRFAAAVCLATSICNHSLKKKSLSRSGAAAAFCAGLLHMTCGWTFGVVLIAFFITSSKLTKFKQDKKAQYDSSFKLGGQRGVTQVICNSFGGGLAAAVAFVSSVWSQGSVPPAALQLIAWSAFLAHYACCTADTWASELGMLSSSPPRLVTNLTRVPPGVNGAVTLLGLAAGAAGGLFMGFVLWAVGCVTREIDGFAPLVAGLLQRNANNAGLADSTFSSAQFWILMGLGAGMFGCMVDSLLGATVQFSGYCSKTHTVVSRCGPCVQRISGVAWLSNDAVNALSACLTSCVTAAVVTWLLASSGRLQTDIVI